MLNRILRIVAALISSCLALFLTGLGLVGWLGGGRFQLDVIPWLSGVALAQALVFFGLAGLASVFLTARGISRVPLALWNGIAFGIMVHGFFISNYQFDDAEHFRSALQMTAATAVSVLGSVMPLFGRSRS